MLAVYGAIFVLATVSASLQVATGRGFAVVAGMMWVTCFSMLFDELRSRRAADSVGRGEP